ncbi:MAG: hypothetical protein JF615_00915 [Asticcacaulis sp.]|nr:hypothetical protein [Asticcacaulis sp.]
MNRTFLPDENYLMISFHELETAWRMLASPDKLPHITDTVKAIRELNRQHGPEKAVFTMISATAWLTEDFQTTEMGFGSGDG